MKDNELIAFDMYFASLSAMQFHPGAGTKDHKKLTLDECADMALRMLDIRRAAIASGHPQSCNQRSN